MLVKGFIFRQSSPVPKVSITLNTKIAAVANIRPGGKVNT
jgi:hypothetical protein